MFIREVKTVNKKSGKIYRKHTLAESYRTNKGPRVRTIMQLSTLALPKHLWPVLAGELERRLAGESGQDEFAFPIDEDVECAADIAIAGYHHQVQRKTATKVRKENRNIRPIDINSTASSCYRSLGPELVGHHFWKELKLGELLDNLGFSQRERSLAEGVVLGRLIKPGSDLGTFRWLSCQSSMLELSEAALKKIKKDEVYEIGDRLLEHKEAIEKGLFGREQELFPHRESLYLFDLTNFYFEGVGSENNLTKRGKSKEKRNDCVLVSLALIVDSSGFPVISRVYKGNIGEPSTLSEILSEMNYFAGEGQLVFSQFKPTLVMDRGIATGENIEFLKEKQLPFIVIERSPREKEYEALFLDYEEKFEQVDRPNHGKPVWVYKLAESENDAATDQKTARVLCMSEGRRAKEEAIDKMKWQIRAVEDIERLISSVSKGYVKAVEKVHQRIGRLKERYPGFDNRFKLIVAADEKGEKVISVAYQKTDGDQRPTSHLHGCYVIDTTHIEKDAPEIWQLYMILSRVEAAFKSLKTDLKLAQFITNWPIVQKLIYLSP